MSISSDHVSFSQSFDVYDNILSPARFVVPDFDDFGNLDIPGNLPTALPTQDTTADPTTLSPETPSLDPSSLIIQPTELTFVLMLTEKKRVMINYLDFQYQDRQRTRKDGSRVFRCKEAKKLGCRASLDVNGDLTRILVVNRDHNHVAN